MSLQNMKRKDRRERKDKGKKMENTFLKKSYGEKDRRTQLNCV